jgi:hypothetical protein
MLYGDRAAAAVVMITVAGITGGALVSLNSGFLERIAEARLLARRTEELEQSKEWMLISQSAAELETWDMDLDSGAISGSPGYWKWHGFPPGSQDSHRDHWLLSIHPEDRDAVRDTMQSAVSRNLQ